MSLPAKIAAAVAALAAACAVPVAAEPAPDGAFPTPEDALRQALAFDDTDASTTLRLGLLLRSQGRLDEAARLIDRAAELDPSLFIEGVGLRGSIDTSCGQTGPDILVGDVSDVRLMDAVDGYSAYGVGTTSCNIGDEGVLWQANTRFHPVIAQNIYRVTDERMEQIGVGFVKHGFLALTGNLCCTCMGSGGSVLSPGCSDPYTGSLNGNTTYLGPRYEINPSIGFFDMPFTRTQIDDGLSRRCAVPNELIDPDLNPGVAYYAEGHYVASDDALAGNDLNNASHRQVVFSPSSFVDGGFNAAVTGPTVRGEPAIFAWQNHDPNVQVESLDILIDGRIYVAHTARDLGDGTWRYEYAVYNFNSDRAAGAFAVKIPAGVEVTNVGFNDVDYDDGEIWDETDWTADISAEQVEWSAAETYDQNPQTNAVRWGTMYNFWFDADTPPADTGRARVAYFKPGDPSNGVVPVVGPSAPPCPADITGDGVVDTNDLGALIAGWGDGDLAADINGSGAVDSQDLAILIAAWGDC